jgi:hypothetical protein
LGVETPCEPTILEHNLDDEMTSAPNGIYSIEKISLSTTRTWGYIFTINMFRWRYYAPKCKT